MNLYSILYRHNKIIYWMNNNKQTQYSINNMKPEAIKDRGLPSIKGIIGEAIPYTIHSIEKAKRPHKLLSNFIPKWHKIKSNEQTDKTSLMKKNNKKNKFQLVDNLIKKQNPFTIKEMQCLQFKQKKDNSLSVMTSTPVRHTFKSDKLNQSEKLSSKDYYRQHQKTQNSADSQIDKNPENMNFINLMPEIEKNYATRTNLIEYTNIRNKINRKFRYNQVKLVPKFRYILGTGNNSEIVQSVLKKRGNWIETNQKDSLFNLRWEQQTEKHLYHRLNYSKYKQMINHLQNHEAISTKGGIIRTLMKYCKRNGIEAFKIIPLSFVFNWEQHGKLEEQMKRFIYYYVQYHPYQKYNLKKNRQYIEIMKSISRNDKVLNFGFEKTNIKQYPPLFDIYKAHSDPQTSETHHNPYLWIIKPTECNRGTGIQLFNNLDDFIKIIKKWEPLKHFAKEFVIQKYIEKPKLIRNRKFDIRVWMLIDNEGKGYFFEEGYIRTSSQAFNIDKNDIQNTFIHLTNNAIQKNNPNYGAFEEGNQLNFDDFTKQMGPQCDFRENFIPKIKSICSIIYEASHKKLSLSNNTFEIFGLDFMIDQKNQVWLIEVNTNPCLELSSKILKQLIPRMLDDAFKLVLDPIFKPLPDQQYAYPVQGYQDDKNLWSILEPFNKQYFNADEINDKLIQALSP